MPSVFQPLSRLLPSDAWASSGRCLDTHRLYVDSQLCWRELRRPRVFRGIRPSQLGPSSSPMDSSVWDLGPGLSPESVIGSAQAVGAHAPVPDLLLWSPP